jgi:hypothetical protein
MAPSRFSWSLLAALLLALEVRAAPLEWDAADHGGDMVASGSTVTRTHPSDALHARIARIVAGQIEYPANPAARK